MLPEFIAKHGDELIARAREKVATRAFPRSTQAEHPTRRSAWSFFCRYRWGPRKAGRATARRDRLVLGSTNARPSPETCRDRLTWAVV